MKKIFLATLFLGIAGITASAQGFIFGARGSYTLGNTSGLEKTVYNGSKDGGMSGINGGAFIKYTINKHFSVNLDILHSLRGGKYSNTDTLSNGLISKDSYQQDFQYFEIPLMFSYHLLGDDSKINPYVGIGITGMAAHYTSLKTTNDISGKLNNRDTSFSYTSRLNNSIAYNKVDYGVVLGAGVSYQINSKWYASIDARYTKGLVDLRENKIVNKTVTEDNSNTPSPVRNTAIAVFFSVGMQLWDGK
jgi:hypothetical protein